MSLMVSEVVPVLVPPCRTSHSVKVSSRELFQVKVWEKLCRGGVRELLWGHIPVLDEGINSLQAVAHSGFGLKPFFH